MQTLEELLEAIHASGIEQVQDFEKFSQYAIVHHSTAIEGSTLTATETRVLLEDGLCPNARPLVHAYMVYDNYRALQFTLQRAKEPLTPTLIQQINSSVMSLTGAIYETVFGQIDASKGELRKANVWAGDHYFMNYDKVPEALVKFCRHIESQQPATNTEKLRQSWAAHFDLVSIHPFYDGNGRTARLVMNLLQKRSGLPLGLVHQEDKADYYLALEAAGNESSLEPFYTFMEGQYQKQYGQELRNYHQELKLKHRKGFSTMF